MKIEESSFLQKVLRPIRDFFSKIRSLFQTQIWLRRVTVSLIAIVLLVLVYKVLASVFGWGGPQYKTAALEEGPLAVTISASGTLNPVKSVQVGTQVSGMVQEIYVDFNDVVKKGQVIARIDPREWQARFEQAEANYILAKRNHDNNKRLIEKNFISTAALDQTLSAYKSAKASLAMAKKALDDTVIRSPVDGVVVKRSVERGQTVAASLQAPELFIIAQDLADMQVETAIDESDVGRITEGMTATFTVDAFPGKIFQSKVKQVRKAPINVQNVITYTVLLSAQNTDLKLLPGMTANTSIITEQKEKVLRISNAALRFKMPNTESADNKSGSRSAGSGSAGANSANKPAGAKPMGAGPRVMTRKVWVLDQSGLKDKPVQKTVRLGLSDGNASEVLPSENGETELKSGDLVITGITGASKSSGARPAGPRLFEFSIDPFMTLIKTHQLVKSYGIGEQTVHALDGVSVSIEQGEFVAIVGASGSGKSTFMNMIGCLDQPNSGSYDLGGEDVANMSSDELADLRNRRIGFIFQQFNLLARTSSIENVALPLLYARVGPLAGLSKEQRYEHAKQRLEQVGLGERLLNTPAQLSGGQQQRVAIARALVNDPDLILADEPTGALDSKTSAEVMALLTQLNQQGMTVVVVTHEPDVAAYASRTITFKDGKIIDDSPNKKVSSLGGLS